MGVTVKLEDAEALKAALAQFPRSTARNIQVRVLLKAVQPLVATAKALAPKRYGYLWRSISATTRRPRGRKTAAARAFAAERGTGGSVAEARAAAKEAGSGLVEVFVGPGRYVQATMQEFGTVYHSGHPYMRPAWDMHKPDLVPEIMRSMLAEIEKAAAKAARKAAKRAR